MNRILTVLIGLLVSQNAGANASPHALVVGRSGAIAGYDLMQKNQFGSTKTIGSAVRGGSTPSATAPKVPTPTYISSVVACTIFPSLVRYAIAPSHASYPERWQVAIAVCWAANNIAVMVPGRYDGISPSKSELSADTANLFAPAGWAFAIWGPIFLGEWLMMLALTNTNNDALINAGKIVAPGWCAGTLAQILWCASFRPEIGATNLWVPTSLLGASAIGLGFAHRALRELGDLPIVVNLLVRWPLVLHFGWITAAMLVNFNKWLSLRGTPVSFKSLASKVSVVAALAAAFFVSYTTRDPIFSGVIAWALAAVGTDASSAARGVVDDAVLDFNAKFSTRSSFVAGALCLLLIGPGAFK